MLTGAEDVGFIKLLMIRVPCCDDCEVLGRPDGWLLPVLPLHAALVRLAIAPKIIIRACILVCLESSD